MSAQLERLQAAAGYLTQALVLLESSLPVTPENAPLLRSIRAGRDRLNEIVLELARAGGRA